MSIGVISIPSINCKFDLNWDGKSMNEHQHNALLYKKQGVTHVGNHYNSHSPSGGYWRLENVKVGDKAHLEYSYANGTKVETVKGDYSCYAVMLLDVIDMKFFHNGMEKRFEPTDLICTTCVGHDGTHNYVAVFEKVG